MEHYQTVFSNYKNDLQAIAPLIDKVVRNKQYGVVGFKQGVILLQKDTKSNSETIKAWQNYLKNIEPMLKT